MADFRRGTYVSGRLFRSPIARFWQASGPAGVDPVIPNLPLENPTNAVSVALVGQSTTVSAGTLAPAVDVPLVGAVVTVSVGAVVPESGVPLVGAASSVTAGGLAPEFEVPLAGIAVSPATGTLVYAPSLEVALTGIATSALAGNLGVEFSVPLFGIEGVVQAGSLVPEGGGGEVPDTHDGGDWREYRRRVRKLAELAEDGRRARNEDVAEIRREIQAAMRGAASIDAPAVKRAVAAVPAKLRAPTDAAIMATQDWAPMTRAIDRLEAAIAYELMIDEDDEEVLLLI